jgi:hypothetical protein
VDFGNATNKNPSESWNDFGFGNMDNIIITFFQISLAGTYNDGMASTNKGEVMSPRFGMDGVLMRYDVRGAESEEAVTRAMSENVAAGPSPDSTH